MLGLTMEMSKLDVVGDDGFEWRNASLDNGNVEAYIRLKLVMNVLPKIDTMETLKSPSQGRETC